MPPLIPRVGVLIVGDLPEAAAVPFPGAGEATDGAAPDVALVPTAAEASAALHRGLAPGADPRLAVVVVTATLPDATAAAVAAEARLLDPDVPVVVAVTPEELSTPELAALDAFALLVRPVAPLVLSTTLSAAIRHHLATGVHRPQLEETLIGLVDVLVETLAVASPIAYSRTGRMRLLMDRVTAELDLQDDWRLRVAALVSQIGCFAVPGPVLAKVEEAVRLSPTERQMYVGSLALASTLLREIPQMGEVASWVGGQLVEFADLGPGPVGELPRVCFDAVAAFVAGYDAGLAPGEIDRLLQASGRYPTEVLDAVRGAADVLMPKGLLETVSVDDVRVGMVITENVTTDGGLLLLRRGERVTNMIEQRLHNFAVTVGVAQPITVLLPGRRPPGKPRRLRADHSGAAGAAPGTPA